MGSGGDKRKEDNPMFRRANKMDVKELREDIDEMKKQHDEKLDKMKKQHDDKLEKMMSDMITEMKIDITEMKKESDKKMDEIKNRFINSEKKTDDRFDNL